MAISSFRNDDSVVRLVETAIQTGLHPFSEVLIVDSLGTGRMEQTIEDRGWGGSVIYVGHDRNLGSAGNLARRLEIGAARGHDWVYAINHDGELDLRVVRTLASHGARLTRPGAVYPLRYKVGRGRYDLTGGQALPLPFRGTVEKPTRPEIPVYWGSSNGTLYSTVPIRAGVVPWADLWMAWEDLGYGWALRHHGYEQVIATAAVTRDHYEYVTERRLGYEVTVIDKPEWYAYYSMRVFTLTANKRQHERCQTCVTNRSVHHDW
jgi:GT2 family glycosyltransferase